MATAPSAAASAPRAKLDLSLPRGGDIANRSSTGVFQMMPIPPERKSKMAEEMEKAGKADCRTAHSDKGLLAVVPLALDAARDKGCRW